MSDNKTTETLDKLYLEWSQFTYAKTRREIDLERQLQEARATIESNATELDKYRNGYKGGCYACETVALTNQALEQEIRNPVRRRLIQSLMKQLAEAQERNRVYMSALYECADSKTWTSSYVPNMKERIQKIVLRALQQQDSTPGREG